MDQSNKTLKLLPRDSFLFKDIAICSLCDSSISLLFCRILQNSQLNAPKYTESVQGLYNVYLRNKLRKISSQTLLTFDIHIINHLNSVWLHYTIRRKSLSGSNNYRSDKMNVSIYAHIPSLMMIPSSSFGMTQHNFFK